MGAIKGMGFRSCWSTSSKQKQTLKYVAFNVTDMWELSTSFDCSISR